MTDIVEQLKNKRRKIEQLQRDKARQEGQREQLLKRLKDEFGVNSLGEANKKIEALGEELVQNEKLLENLGKEMDEIINAATTKNTTSPEEEN